MPAQNTRAAIAQTGPATLEWWQPFCHSKSLCWASRSFPWRTFQNKHFAQFEENLWRECAPEESLILIRLQRLLIVHTLEHTSKLWATSLALSACFFWTSPSEVYYALRPSMWFVLFQPRGLYRATWECSLSLCVRLSTLPLLCIMSSASPAYVFCG